MKRVVYGLPTEIYMFGDSPLLKLHKKNRFGASAHSNQGYLFGLRLEQAPALSWSAKRSYNEAQARDEEGILASKRHKDKESLHWGEFNPVTSHRACCVWSKPDRAAQLFRVLLEKRASSTTSSVASPDKASTLSALASPDASGPLSRISSSTPNSSVSPSFSRTASAPLTVPSTPSTTTTTEGNDRLAKAKAALEAVKNLLK
eukprot:m.129410 g.129410  ORF g.129410 m.129410 type:complete len:203 (-) comp15696_c0_seq5:257-865(-)